MGGSHDGYYEAGRLFSAVASAAGGEVPLVPEAGSRVRDLHEPDAEDALTVAVPAMLLRYVGNADRDGWGEVMRVIEVDEINVPIGSTLLAIADAVQEQARDMVQAALDGTEGNKECAADYLVVCNALARRVRAAVERFDADVLAHLEGQCEAH